MRGSRIKNELKTQVITSKIQNPDKTLKEIEKETGLPKSTISDIIKEDIPEIRNSSEVIAKMVDDNNKILNLTGVLLLGKLEAGESVRIEEIIKARDLALKQNKLVEVIDNKDKDIVYSITF